MSTEGVTDQENLLNFQHLPFSFVSPISSFHSINSGFIQIPCPPNISSPSLNHLVQNFTDIHSCRHATPTTSPNSSPTPSTTSTDSLPPLEPNTDYISRSSISDTVNRHLSEDFLALNIRDPPRYTPSIDQPPDYNLLRHDTCIQRRIRTLEEECVEVIAQLREFRDSALTQLAAEVNLQIEEQITRYRKNITRLENQLSSRD